jgi:hypothetical protein
MPEMLRQVFGEAAKARLSIDTGKYEVDAPAGSGVARYRVAFPVTGTYPDVRAFLDATLASMPTVALSDLAIERRSIADASVEAQIRMTFHTSAGGNFAVPRPPTPPPPPEPGPDTSDPMPLLTDTPPASARVVTPAHARALFAAQTWAAPLPPPLPVVPLRIPEPTAPPLPYTFIGSYAPAGETPVFFLMQGGRVTDARVGDSLDGVYQFESATEAELVFLYLPLKIRQTLPLGVSR